mmetsp:Transcript_89782/g.155420  ORF Transcript_89782/g.155420 Transcript_89782/m.155420 type:complete len:304 (+) Transcript_89782:142-1053(+)
MIFSALLGCIVTSGAHALVVKTSRSVDLGADDWRPILGDDPDFDPGAGVGDWRPNVGDNAELENGSPIRVACVGASITLGGIGTGEPYPSILQKLLGDGYVVENLGVNSRTIGYSDLPYQDSAQFTELASSQWDIVVSLFGASDATDVGSGGKPHWRHALCDSYTDPATCPFMAGYNEWISFLQSTGIPDIFIVVPPPVTGPNYVGVNSTVVNVVMHEMVPKIAVEKGIPPDHVIDMFSELGGDSISNVPKGGCTANISQAGVCRFLCDENYCDNVHPVAAGKLQMAAVIADAIRARKPLTKS